MADYLRIDTGAPEETQALGRILGEQIVPGDVFLLTGPLGAGKTCLTQGIAWGLGVTEYARSPTFVIMTRYRGRLTLHHFDLYRINDPLEAWDLGLDEQLFGDGACVVEWADRAEDVFPAGCLWVHLDYAAAGDGRTITFVEPPDRYLPMLERVAQAFGSDGPEKAVDRAGRGGDASMQEETVE